MDSVKEDILKLLKNKGIEAMKVYFVYSKTGVSNKTLSVVVVGRKKLDLLKDSIEYEEYSSNMAIEKKCGGCQVKRKVVVVKKMVAAVVATVKVVAKIKSKNYLIKKICKNKT